MNKVCRGCGEEKELSEFNKNKKCNDGHLNYCRICTNKQNRQHYIDNIDYYRDRHKKRRETHKEENSKNFKVYYNNNNKDYFREKGKIYNNSEKGKKKRLEWCNNYNAKNKHVVLWRSLLRRTIVQLKQEKDAKTVDMLGYTSDELKQHIEKNWLNDMRWDNYGDWHVDHIRSVATFDKNTPASIVNSLSNLQPMWATTREINGVLYEGNLNKGKRID